MEGSVRCDERHRCTAVQGVGGVWGGERVYSAARSCVGVTNVVNDTAG